MTPSLILLLDGGAGRRMGGVDKGLLRLAGADTLLAVLVRRLRAQGGSIAIGANGDPARFKALGLPVLPDAVGPGFGPLAGVLAGLDDVAAIDPAGTLLTVPGDTPLVPGDLVRRLTEAAIAGIPCVRACSGGRRHPLVALWSAALRAPLRDALTRRDLRKVEAFQAEAGCATVTWSTDPYDPFLNINTPDDLAAARRLAGDHALRMVNT